MGVTYLGTSTSETVSRNDACNRDACGSHTRRFQSPSSPPSFFFSILLLQARDSQASSPSSPSITGISVAILFHQAKLRFFTARNHHRLQALFTSPIHHQSSPLLQLCHLWPESNHEASSSDSTPPSFANLRPSRPLLSQATDLHQSIFVFISTATPFLLFSSGQNTVVFLTARELPPVCFAVSPAQSSSPEEAPVAGNRRRREGERRPGFQISPRLLDPLTREDPAQQLPSPTEIQAHSLHQSASATSAT